MGTRQIFNQTFSVEVTIAAVVGFLVVGTALFALVHARAREGRKAGQKPSHPKIEGAYLFVVVGVVAYLLTNSLVQNGAERAGAGPGSGDPALTVTITGFQWCWRFAYSGAPVVVSGDCISGKGPVLTLPARVPVRLEVTSADVVHEMWVPYLRFKMEAIPGHVNSDLEVIGTTGLWDARCSEFCGPYHYAMDFEVRAITKGAFEAWLRHEEKSVKPGGVVISGAP